MSTLLRISFLAPLFLLACASTSPVNPPAAERDVAGLFGSKSFPLKRAFETEGWLTRALPRPDSAVLTKNIGGRSGPAVCFKLLPGEKAAGGKRAELTDYHMVPLGKDVTYKFSTWLPRNYNTKDGNANVIAQWHTPDRDHKPPMAFRLREGRLDVTLNFVETNHIDPEKSQQVRILKYDNFKLGVWHDFVFTVRWHAQNGSVDGWINGKKVVEYRGPTEYPSQTEGPYFKYGIYMSKDLTTPRELCHGPYSRETPLF